MPLMFCQTASKKVMEALLNGLNVDANAFLATKVFNQ
jgi:hypothetical protein